MRDETSAHLNDPYVKIATYPVSNSTQTIINIGLSGDNQNQQLEENFSLSSPLPNQYMMLGFTLNAGSTSYFPNAGINYVQSYNFPSLEK